MGSGNYISSRTIVCRCEGVHDHRGIRRHERDAARSLSDGRVDASATSLVTYHHENECFMKSYIHTTVPKPFVLPSSIHLSCHVATRIIALVHPRRFVIVGIIVGS